MKKGHQENEARLKAYLAKQLKNTSACQSENKILEKIGGAPTKQPTKTLRVRKVHLKSSD
jgi:hypothetical protein